MKLTTDEYMEHCDGMDGYCTSCQDFTRFGMTEPDAEDYPCEKCGGNSCVGVENALMMDLLEIS